MLKPFWLALQHRVDVHEASKALKAEVARIPTRRADAA